MSTKYWEISFGSYPGVMLGFRTYENEPEEVVWDGEEATMIERNHVLYVPFFDLCFKLITMSK